MTDSIDPRGDQMAADLIAHVKRTHTPRLALLEDRIAATLRYLDGADRPTSIRIEHVRAFLTGERDSMIALKVAADADGGDGS